MWLVQRGTVEKDWTKGMKVTEFIRPDYMGSAEFEFGTLPKSLRAMGEKNLEQFKFSMGDKVIYVLCEKEEYDEVKDNIVKLANGSIRLKEWVSLRDWVYPEVRGHDLQEDPSDNFWWDVGGHYVFSLKHNAIRDFPKALETSLEYMKQNS